MPTGTIGALLSVGNDALQVNTVTETGDHVNNYDIALAAGKAGTLTTRTNDGEGVITLGAANTTIAVADLIDIYWAGGARYAVRVDSLSGSNDVELNFDDTPGGTGDVLPADETAVIVCERVTINTAIDGDNVQLFGLQCDQRSQITFYDVGDAIIKQYTLPVAFTAHTWCQSSDVANALTGNPITYAKASNGSTTAATMRIRCLQDSTP
jgi:hypothetical protein